MSRDCDKFAKEINSENNTKNITNLYYERISKYSRVERPH